MTISGEDLKFAFKRAGLTQQEVADNLGMTRQNLSLHLSKRVLSSELLQKVRDKIQIDWSLLANDKSDAHTNIIPIDKNRLTRIPTKSILKSAKADLIPYYDIDFMAGDMELVDAEEYIVGYYDIPELAGCTAFNCRNDSMAKLINPGGRLFGKKVPDWIHSLDYGGIYGITMKDGQRYLKYVRKSKDENKLLFVPENTASYDPFEVHVSKIKNIWKIEAYMNFF